MAKTRVAIVGLGNIGCAVAAAAGARSDIELVAGVDIDPGMAGRDLGETCGSGRIGFGVRSDLPEALAAGSPDVVIIATGSRLVSVAPVVLEALDHGADVVSSCEELVWPWEASPAVADEIDRAARRNDSSVLGVGVNPGFVQDLLVVVAAGATRNINKVRGSRMVDLSARRKPLQAKMGVGLTPAEFEERQIAGKLGHVGIEQSIQVIAAGLGIELDGVEVEDGPLIAETDLRAEATLVGVGLVRGMWTRATGRESGQERVCLELEMGIGTDSEDRIEIDAEPPISMVLEGGVQGDEATVARIVNAIDQVIDAPPGLLSVIDLPPVPPAKQGS